MKTWMLKTWEEGRLLWDAKGLKIEAIALDIPSHVDVGERKLSESNIQRLSLTSKPLDPDVAEFIVSRPTLPSREHLTEIVEAGLEVLAGEDRQPKLDTDAVADALAARLPKPDVDALAQGVASRLPTPDAMAEAVAGKLPRLDTAAVVAELSDKLPRSPDAGAVASGVVRLLAPWLVGASVGIAAGFVGLFVLLRQHAVPATTPPVAWCVVNLGTGAETPPREPQRSTPGATIAGPYLDAYAVGVHRVGEKMPADRYIPNELLPRQKPPPCDEATGEEAINGGCWASQARVKPPCGRLYRKGDECYLPVAADPKVPLSDDAR